MKILITGNMGYVGPVLVRHLRENYPDADLNGLDLGYFGTCLSCRTIVPGMPAESTIFCRCA